MKLNIPEPVEIILRTIESHGYEAYAVGGCVRDAILGRIPHDWDITTSAKPEQVKAMFRRTIDTGLQHGTVTVMIDKEGFEVTTYRVDGEYEDGRHPKEVTFTASLEEDLQRRDFTINAMAYHPVRGIMDPFAGQQDLEKKMIRCVGNPIERFTEDALRILRAIRFSAQLGFTIEDKTREALKVLAPNLKHVSAERIQAELVKLLVSPHPDYIRIAYEAQITPQFLPELDAMMHTPQNNPHHWGSVGEHTLESLGKVPPDKVLRLTMLLHDCGKPLTRTTDEKGCDHFIGHPDAGEALAGTILRRLKFDNDTISKVKSLVRWHDYRPLPTQRAVRKAMNRIGRDMFPLCLKVQRADILSQSSYEREEKLESLRKVEALYKQIEEQNQCVSIRELAITGRDLIAMGIAPGPRIGMILETLLEMVLETPELNQKEVLMKMVEEKGL